jgi:ethanolamine utilization protein EutN
MDIHQVRGSLVMTSRLDGLAHFPLKVLVDANGQETVALDMVGVKSGDWVFTIAFSAARAATGNMEILTDLTVAGIIDVENNPEITSGPARA